MAITLVQSKSAAVNVAAATNPATWDTPATAGNLLVLCVASDAYVTGVPAGWTESTGAKQETFFGGYVWWKSAVGGETTQNYAFSGPATSCWVTLEVSGVTPAPYDTSAGQLAGFGASTYTTPALTPTAGARYLVAVIGGSNGSNSVHPLFNWLNSFTVRQTIGNTLGSGTRDALGVADLVVTADGVTAYSTGAEYTTGSAQARTATILAFIADAPAPFPINSAALFFL